MCVCRSEATHGGGAEAFGSSLLCSDAATLVLTSFTFACAPSHRLRNHELTKTCLSLFCFSLPFAHVHWFPIFMVPLITIAFVDFLATTRWILSLNTHSHAPWKLTPAAAGSLVCCSLATHPTLNARSAFPLLESPQFAAAGLGFCSELSVLLRIALQGGKQAIIGFLQPSKTKQATY